MSTATATSLEPPLYGPKAHMILGLLRGFRFRPDALIVHRDDHLDTARVALRREKDSEVVRQVRRGVEALRLAEAMDNDIAQGISILCDTMLDLLDPCAPQIGSALDVGPEPMRSQVGPALQPHDPTPVVFAPANTPLTGPRPGTRWIAPLGQVDPADMGEVR